jgi:hypothetical protein
LRNAASYSPRVRSSIIGFSFLALEPGLELLDDFLVRGGEGGLGSCRRRPAFDVELEFEQEFGGPPIALGRLIDELLDNGLAFTDFSPPAILGDDDELVECFAEQGR